MGAGEKADQLCMAACSVADEACIEAKCDGSTAVEVRRGRTVRWAW